MLSEVDFEFAKAREDFGNMTLLKFAELASVERFCGMKMIHRTNLDIHHARTTKLTWTCAQALRTRGVMINLGHAMNLIRVHDDQEVITGDIPTPTKLAMTEEEQEELKGKEEAAIITLAKRYVPPEFQDMYLQLWHEARDKKTLESQTADIADKWDAICETVHEIRCGNVSFFEVLDRYRSKIIPRLQNHEIWSIISTHPDIRLDRIPTPSEADQLPKISIETLRKSGQEAFWQEVLDQNVPEFYRRWIVDTFSCGLSLDMPGTALFPGWGNEPLNQKPRMYLLRLPWKKITK